MRQRIVDIILTRSRKHEGQVGITDVFYHHLGRSLQPDKPCFRGFAYGGFMEEMSGALVARFLAVPDGNILVSDKRRYGFLEA